MEHFAAAVLKYYKDVQDVEGSGGYGAEVDGPAFVQVIPKESHPGLGTAFRTLGLHHVLADRVRVWGIKAEEDEMVVNALGGPQAVLAAQPTNEQAHLFVNGRATTLYRLPSPEETEALPVPLYDGSGLH